MKKTDTSNIEDRQAEIDDIKKQLDSISAALDAAETCETPSDFDSNIDDALSLLTAIVVELKELRR